MDVKEHSTTAIQIPDCEPFHSLRATFLARHTCICSDFACLLQIGGEFPTQMFPCHNAVNVPVFSPRSKQLQLQNGGLTYHPRPEHAKQLLRPTCTHLVTFSDQFTVCRPTNAREDGALFIPMNLA